MDEKELGRFGIRIVKSSIAMNEGGAVRAASKIGYPVVLKIISPEIVHKSDKGCVVLDIADEKGLRSAYKEITERASGFKVEGMLVQRMARKGVELIVGGKKDPQFGQVIVFGLGGLYVEVLRDFSMRVCPITKSDGAEMIREIRGYPILAGVRGKKPVNEEKLIDLLVNVSRFLVKKNPKEFDLNPVIADGEGYDIVDTRIVW
jgi:acetyl-CoA synthetase (ADP-forming)